MPTKPAQRENFFILLGLSPDEESLTVIRTRFDMKVQQWTKSRQNPLAGSEAKRNLKLKDEIEEVLLKNPAKRQEEADACRRILRVRDESLDREIDEKIQLIADGRSKITESQFADVRVEFKSHFTDSHSAESRIRDRLRALKITVVADSDAAPQSLPPPIDRVQSSEIVSYLKQLGHRDLFAFLNQPALDSPAEKPPLTPQSPLDALKAKADKVAEDARRRPNLDDWTLRGKLAGQCLSLFRDESLRQRYIVTLLTEALDNDLRTIAKTASAASPNQLKQLVGRAAQHRIDETLTLQFISQKLADHTRGPRLDREDFEKRLEAARAALRDGELIRAEELIGQLRTLAPHDASAAELQHQLQSTKDRIQTQAELSATVKHNRDERSIVEAAKKVRQAGGEPLPKEVDRVAEAEGRVSLLELLKGLPGDPPSEQDDADFERRWTTNPQAEKLLAGSTDPDCRSLLKTWNGVQSRLKWLKQLRDRIESCDTGMATESDIHEVASRLPKEYDYALLPRVRLARALLVVPPSDEAVAKAWIELRDAKLDVGDPVLRERCSQAAKRLAAAIRLDPWLPIVSEHADREYLRNWDTGGFSSGDTAGPYRARADAARHRVKFLDNLQSLVNETAPGLATEHAIAQTAKQFPAGYKHRFGERAELSLALTVSPVRERAIADAWEKVREADTKPQAAETIRRCEQALLRRDALQKLNAMIPLGTTERFDRDFAEVWNNAELGAVSDVDSLQPQFIAVQRRLRIVDDMAEFIRQPRQNLSEEQELVRLARELPDGYQHSHLPRVALSAALVAVPVSEEAIVDAWQKLGEPASTAVSSAICNRAQTAVLRREALQRLRSLPPGTPLDEIDQAFGKFWDDALFEGCADAEPFRSVADVSRKRRDEWSKLDAVLNEGRDCLRAKQLADSPRLMNGYSPLEKRRGELESLVQWAPTVKRLKEAAKIEDRDRFVAEFAASGLAVPPEIISYYWDHLGAFISDWWQGSISLGPAATEPAWTADRREVSIKWRCAADPATVVFEFATSSTEFFESPDAPQCRTQVLTRQDLLRAGGGVKLAAPPTGKLLYFSLWAVRIWGKMRVASRPLHIGPLRPPDVDRSFQSRKLSRFRHWLFRILNG